jgi:hypothetical protein
MDQCFDLESVAPQPCAVRGRLRGGVETEDRYVASPEHIESVTQVRVTSVIQNIDDHAEHAVTEAAQPSDIAAAPRGRKSGAFREVSAVEKCGDKTRNFRRVV